MDNIIDFDDFDFDDEEFVKEIVSKSLGHDMEIGQRVYHRKYKFGTIIKILPNDRGGMIGVKYDSNKNHLSYLRHLYEVIDEPYFLQQIDLDSIKRGWKNGDKLISVRELMRSIKKTQDSKNPIFGGSILKWSKDYLENNI